MNGIWILNVRDYHICRISFLQGSAWQVQNLGRIVTHLLYKLRKSEDSSLYKSGVTKCKAGLDSHNSESCSSHGTVFVFLGVWGMIRAYHLNVSLLQTFNQRIHIFSGTERRIHFIVWVISFNIIRCEYKMMGANFCCYILNAFCL